jgi:metal-responsive CopG/Arc/MetJ family transcriptional regulator
MKTAVSIPDPLFEAADQLAARLGISRSALYARALARELSVESDDEVTARLNDVYSSVGSELDPLLAARQRRTLSTGS